MVGFAAEPLDPGVVALDPALRLLAFPVRASVVAGLFLAGIWICEKSAARLGVHDHPAIVWDEVVGYLAMMLVVPAGWLWAVAGFCFFRFFDIVKPWPIRDVDHAVGGGFGIMLDDLLAAGYGALALLVMKTLLAQP